MDIKLDLRPEELAFLESNASRCDACGHLMLVHNTHCCSYCEIPGCRCEFGELSEDDGWETQKS